MTDVLSYLAGALLSAAAFLTLIRIIRGPSVLDRVVASEVMVAIVICVLGVEAAVTRHTATLPILISLSLVSFAGSVAVARFVARDRDDRDDRPAGEAAGGPAENAGR